MMGKFRMRTVVAVLILAVATQAACNRSVPQQDFASVEAAVDALVAAANTEGSRALLEVLGAEAEPVIDSGDPVQDRNSRQQFLQTYAAAHAVDRSSDDTATLEVGADEWPFPFPLVERDGRWRFDGAAGVEETVNRRVGENELSTIQSCLAFVDAQREYYMRNAQRDALLHFSRKLISTAGQKDGLYWPTAPDEAPSPLGEQFAQARSEGYFEEGVAKSTPFHGYIYRLLTAQGPHARGGAYDYLVGDQMLGGFALIAFPAQYGSSGVMTFMVNHDGVVFSKDLGPAAAKAAQAIDTFDPDASWSRETVIE
jgi:hypothetical protein